VALFARVRSDGLDTGLAVSPSAPAGPIASPRDWHVDGRGVKLYAETHLAEVAGLVLVDATEEDVYTRNEHVDPGRHAGRPALLAKMESCLDAKPSDLVEGSDLYTLCVSGD
jgi:hypothetical protein